MKNGGQKDLRIHENWDLGCPGVDFLSSGDRFGRGRKGVDFWIAPWWFQNRPESSHGASKGGNDRKEGDRVGTGWSTLMLEAPRAAAYYQRIR